MDNIEFIKKEIANLKNEVGDIYGKLVELSTIVEKKEEDRVSGIEYDKINKLSKHIVINRHFLSDLDDSYISKVYLKVLVEFIKTCIDFRTKEIYYSYVQWIINQCKNRIDLKKLISDNIDKNGDLFDDALHSLPDNYRERLFLDLIIIAYMENKNSNNVMNHILYFGSLLGISDKSAKKIFSIAKYVITKRNMENIDKEYFIENFRYLMEDNDYLKLMNSCRHIIYAFKAEEFIFKNILKIEEERLFSSEVNPAIKKNQSKSYYVYGYPNNTYIEKDKKVIEIISVLFRKVKNSNTFYHHLKYDGFNTKDVITSDYSGYMYKIDIDGMVIIVVSSKFDDLDSITKFVKDELKKGKIKVIDYSN